MRKMIIILIMAIFIIIPVCAFASDAGYEGGIANEYEYKEVVFVSGAPVIFSGTLTVSSSSRSGTTTTTYRYQLSTTTGDRLTRTVTLFTTDTQKPDYKQVISTTNVERYSENIRIGNDNYVLDRNNGYVYNGSQLKSASPGVNYFAGNYSGIKIYRVNGNQGTVKVYITDKTVGFDHNYGSVKTHRIDFLIDSTRDLNNNTVKWSGEAHVDVSFAEKSSLDYIQNDPQYISFRGGYLLEKTGSDVMNYTYDLPKLDDNGNEIGRNTGSGSLRLDEVPSEKRLVVPDVKDITGTWGADSIKELLSMEVFPNDSTYFGPKFPILRSDFTVAVSKAINLAPYKPAKTSSYNQKSKNQEVSPFIDVPVNDANYGYIKAASDAGLISGTAPFQFSPAKSLTRAQAAVIFIRALGLENLGPTGNFNTGFADDSKISVWAKRDIYVAREIGLISGDENGNFNPDSPVTREEAASMISRMIDFMMNDLTVDYVERVLNY